MAQTAVEDRASVGPPPVEVGFAGPSAQNRLTVAFRLLLAIPAYVVMLVLSLAALVLTVVGWFAALVTGRLPEGMARFISQVVRYTTRVTAYGYLMTDWYPPFDLNAEQYPVDVVLQPTRLNRVAVLFRLILAIPAYIVVGLVSLGVSLAAFFIWLIVLVAGRMPDALYQAVASVLRYETRYYAYMALVSAAYPAGLFGDRSPDGSTAATVDDHRYGVAAADAAEPGAAVADVAEPGAGAVADVAEPGAGVADVAEPGAGAAAPDLAGNAAMPEAGASPRPVARLPLVTRLVLSTAARRIVALFLALGVVWIAGYAAISAVTASGGQSGATAAADIQGDYQQLTQSVNSFETATQKCAANDLRCAQAADRQLSPAFSRFQAQVSGTNVPPSATAARTRVAADAGDLKRSLDQMGAAAGDQQYLDIAQTFQTQANTFDTDYAALIRQLNG